jgi:hypothetical protein
MYNVYVSLMIWNKLTTFMQVKRDDLRLQREPVRRENSEKSGI